jgi:hypothetical protein
MAAKRPDPFRGLGLYKRPRPDPVIGREVTWTEDGHELTGQVWDRSPDNGGELATSGRGPLYWIVTAGGREFRVASYAKAEDTFTVGYWIWSPAGRCVRDGKAAA